MKILRLLISLVGGIVLFFLFLGSVTFWFGGFGKLVAYANGESVYISPKTLNLGSFEAGVETVAVFRMTNLTSQEISVVGERSGCNCAFSEKIPITAAPGETADLKINVHLPQYDSAYDQTITLMIAEPGRLVMRPVRITANIPKPMIRPTIPEEASTTNE